MYSLLDDVAPVVANLAVILILIQNLIAATLSTISPFSQISMTDC